MAVSKVDAANQIENQLPQANIAGNVNFRNIIINGDMSIAQRGTSQTNAGDSVGTYDTVDRFLFANQNMGAFTISQDTDVPSSQGFAKSLKLDCTTADASPATNDYLLFIQTFEGQNLQYLKKGTSNATSLTLSFWVKSNKTGTYIAELQDLDNSRTINKSYTVDTANTWEKKTITYAGDTTGTLDNDNGGSLSVQFWLGAGTKFTSGTLATSWETRTNANRAVGQVNLADSTDNEWYITGVQLEAGTTASDFEFLPFDTQLQRCKRYYQKTFAYATTPAQNISANNLLINIVTGGTSDSYGGYFFSVEMRAAPTITTFNPFATNSNFRKPNSQTDVAMSPETFPNFVNFGSSGSGSTALHAHFTVDAEL